MHRILNIIEIGPLKRGADGSLRRDFVYKGETGSLVKHWRSWGVENGPSIDEDLLKHALRRKTQQEFRKGLVGADSNLSVRRHINISPEMAIALDRLKRPKESETQCIRRVLSAGLAALNIAGYSQ